MDQAALYRFLKQHRYAVLSSIGPAGNPQSALIGIACTPSLQIVFDTLRTSRKYPNLMARPRCSLVIGWSGEQTVQMEGIAEEPRKSDLAHFKEIYFHAWPECRAHLTWPHITHVVVHPTWLRYSDYDQNPPFIDEITPTLPLYLDRLEAPN